MNLKRLTRGPAIWIVLAVAILWIGASTLLTPSVQKIDTSAGLQLLSQGKVEQAKIVDGEQRVNLTLTENYSVDGESKGKNVEFFYVTPQGQTVVDAIAKADPKGGYNSEVPRQSWWASLLSLLLPFIIILGIFWFLMSNMQGGGSRVMSFGKSKAKLVNKESPQVGFSDVAGVDEAGEELQEIKEFLADPARFQAVGAKIPRGVLLYGQPGTGKTLLARAVAGEAGVPFYSISGSDFVEMFVGVGASRVRDLFDQAKQNAPAIIFIDEIDAVGRHRGAGMGGGHDEREQTLNQMLVEMDGFDVNTNVILIAATNRPDILDPALLRPGRFDRQVVVDRPDIGGRLGILKIHARGKPLAEDVDLEVIARRTPGFTGADLANLVNEGALLAARHGKKKVDMAELEEGIDRVVAGPERKSRLISDDEKKVIAYHESGHAIVGHVLPHGNSIHKVTIIPRGRSLGSTWHLPEDEKFLGTKSEMLSDLASLLGGRVAEEIAIGDVTTGAGNDIERATKLARQMITRFGMSDKLGPQTFGEANHEVFLGRDFSANADYSPEIAYEIDKEVARFIDEAYEKARTIITEHRAQLDLMATVLVERETIGKAELEALLSDTWETYLADEQTAKDNAPDEPEADDDDSDESAKSEAVASDATTEPQVPPAAPPALDT